jgi:predicted Rossmann fold nucleotide-binding protein DprA/Smf involved in DNA uptake
MMAATHQGPAQLYSPTINSFLGGLVMSIVSDVEEQVRARLKELEPMVAEYRQLQSILEALKHSDQGDQADEQRRPARTPQARPRPGAARPGGRAAQALDYVREHPGTSVAEIADAMGIGATYLYRVLPRLEAEGKLRKDGKRYHVVA